MPSEDLLRELKAKRRLPGFFGYWTLRDCHWVPLHAALLDVSTLYILRLYADRILTAGAALFVARLAYGSILLSLACCLWSNWRARQVRFALAVEKRRRALRAALSGEVPGRGD